MFGLPFPPNPSMTPPGGVPPQGLLTISPISGMPIPSVFMTPPYGMAIPPAYVASPYGAPVPLAYMASPYPPVPMAPSYHPGIPPVVPMAPAYHPGIPPVIPMAPAYHAGIPPVVPVAPPHNTGIPPAHIAPYHAAIPPVPMPPPYHAETPAQPAPTQATSPSEQVQNLLFLSSVFNSSGFKPSARTTIDLTLSPSSPAPLTKPAETSGTSSTSPNVAPAPLELTNKLFTLNKNRTLLAREAPLRIYHPYGDTTMLINPYDYFLQFSTMAGESPEQRKINSLRILKETISQEDYNLIVIKDTYIVPENTPVSEAIYGPENLISLPHLANANNQIKNRLKAYPNPGPVNEVLSHWNLLIQSYEQILAPAPAEAPKKRASNQGKTASNKKAKNDETTSMQNASATRVNTGNADPSFFASSAASGNEASSHGYNLRKNLRPKRF